MSLDDRHSIDPLFPNQSDIYKEITTLDILWKDYNTFEQEMGHSVSNSWKHAKNYSNASEDAKNLE